MQVAWELPLSGTVDVLALQHVIQTWSTLGQLVVQIKATNVASSERVFRPGIVVLDDVSVDQFSRDELRLSLRLDRSVGRLVVGFLRNADFCCSLDQRLVGVDARGPFDLYVLG